MRNRSDADHIESAIEVISGLIHDAEHSASFEWTESGADSQLLDCYVQETPAQKAASAAVGDAYTNLAAALRGYRTATKRALDVANATIAKSEGHR